jgi:hypothetical protein
MLVMAFDYDYSTDDEEADPFADEFNTELDDEDWYQDDEDRESVDTDEEDYDDLIGGNLA